ncbi:TPA: hypothetical protein L7W18_005383 [Klebsiella pneumoniae]|uniref:Uncharacterized protein n=1 Tax=Salmonella enterica TaxID=28901 RepID=A0A7H0RWR8_SALER|nr:MULTISPECIES: hypothetical protein [Enterobacteriaceae]EDX3259289.1 hypothetical protein [Salmonella enterica subsp. enterica serovar Mbandaka]HAT7495808.1 hypothetical protein [Raoultella ornithinolytica]HBQ3314877.1 hypothetical protein [Klebsiella pneumoniae]HCM9335805.1 hypothetical protein [Enterobacter asburiae]HEB0918600.1 hypothetical protein [Enterobacter cloacae]
MMNVLKVSRLVKVANRVSFFDFISLVSEIEGRLKLLHAYSILFAIDGKGDSYFSFEHVSRTTFLVTERLMEYKLLGLIPDHRVKCLDDIFEQCKQVLGDKKWNMAVTGGTVVAQDVLDTYAETFLTTYVEESDTRFLKDFVQWYLSTC